MLRLDNADSAVTGATASESAANGVTTSLLDYTSWPSTYSSTALSCGIRLKATTSTIEIKSAVITLTSTCESFCIPVGFRIIVNYLYIFS